MTTALEHAQATIDRAQAIGEDAARIAVHGRELLAAVAADDRQVLRVGGATVIGYDDTVPGGSYSTPRAAEARARLLAATGQPDIAQVHPKDLHPGLSMRQTAAPLCAGLDLETIKTVARAAYDRAESIGAAGAFFDEIVATRFTLQPALAAAAQVMGFSGAADDERERALGVVRLMAAVESSLGRLGPAITTLGGGGKLTHWSPLTMDKAVWLSKTFAHEHGQSFRRLARQDYPYRASLDDALEDSRRWGRLAHAGFPGSNHGRSWQMLHAKFEADESGSKLRPATWFHAWVGLFPGEWVHLWQLAPYTMVDALIETWAGCVAPYRVKLIPDLKGSA